MSMFPQFLAANHPTLSTEDLLFNIGCLDDSKKEIVGDVIYYIADYITDPESDGGTIWKIKVDGSENAPLSSTGHNPAVEIDSVDDRWVYYTDSDDEARKINLLGYMDQEA